MMGLLEIGCKYVREICFGLVASEQKMAPPRGHVDRRLAGSARVQVISIKGSGDTWPGTEGYGQGSECGVLLVTTYYQDTHIAYGLGIYSREREKVEFQRHVHARPRWC